MFPHQDRNVHNLMNEFIIQALVFDFKKKTKQHLIRGELFVLGRKTARRCEFGDLRNNIGEIYDCSIDYNPVLA